MLPYVFAFLVVFGFVIVVVGFVQWIKADKQRGVMLLSVGAVLMNIPFACKHLPGIISQILR